MGRHREKRESGLLALLLLLVIGLLVGLAFVLFGGDQPGTSPKPTPTAGPPAPDPTPKSSPRPPEPASPSTGNPAELPPAISHENPGPGQVDPPFPLAVDGETPFQRRLSLGSSLMRAMEALKSESHTPRAIASAMYANLAHFLVLDNFTVDEASQKAYGSGNLINEITPNLKLIATGGVSNGKQALMQILEPLIQPRRDREAFQLTTVSPEHAAHPLGHGAPVRVWTIGESFPSAPLETAQETIARISAILGLPKGPGHDFLATPGLGSETFGVLKQNSRASGLYMIPDRFCLARSTLSHDWLPEVLEHEMIHAITFPLGEAKAKDANSGGKHDRKVEPFESSRFVSEGLAEYLRKHEKEDRELDIPAERFRDECALLWRYVVAKDLEGWDFDRLDIKSFVQLKPDEFYGYGAFAYLVAQAAMASQPRGEVLRALKDDASDRRLVRNIERMGWKGLMQFVEKTMAGGDHRRARVMDDGALDRTALENEFNFRIGRKPKGMKGEWPVRFGVKSSGSVEGMLRAIGVTPDRSTRTTDSVNSPTQFFGTVGDTYSEAELFREVMLSLVTAGQVEVHSEVDRALVDTFNFGDISERWLGGLRPSALEARTQWVFLDNFVTELKRVRNQASAAPLGWFEATTGLHSVAVLVPFATRDAKMSLQSFVQRMAAVKGKQVNAVILIGSKDTGLRASAPGLIEGYLTPEQKSQWQRMNAEQRAPVIETALPMILADQIIATEAAFGTVLVVDLANGTGDAKVAFEAFKLVMPAGSKLAYWNPQVALNVEAGSDRR